jgi:hypothetical protein
MATVFEKEQHRFERIAAHVSGAGNDNPVYAEYGRLVRGIVRRLRARATRLERGTYAGHSRRALYGTGDES